MTQFIECRFNPNATRGYTYQNDGEPVAVGDFVEVESARGEGKQCIEVVALLDRAPPFATKPILGKAAPAEEAAAPAVPEFSLEGK